jgi:hypothetical protein
MDSHAASETEHHVVDCVLSLNPPFKFSVRLCTFAHCVNESPVVNMTLTMIGVDDLSLTSSLFFSSSMPETAAVGSEVILTQIREPESTETADIMIDANHQTFREHTHPVCFFLMPVNIPSFLIAHMPCMMSRQSSTIGKGLRMDHFPLRDSVEPGMSAGMARAIHQTYR